MTGLPQIMVDINRAQLARFGPDVQAEERQDIADVRQLFVMPPSELQVPLEQLADVEYRQGPNQIQREDAKRRIIVGFNVRGRDIASVVEKVQNTNFRAEADKNAGAEPITPAGTTAGGGTAGGAPRRYRYRFCQFCKQRSLLAAIQNAKLGRGGTRPLNRSA